MSWLSSAFSRCLTYQSREDWEAARRHTIGASTAPAILGKSPWSTPEQAWRLLKFGERQIQTKAMAQGHLREDFVCRIEGFDPWPQTTVVRHATVSWLTCTPDALQLGGRGFVEIKHSQTWENWQRGAQEIASAAEWARRCPEGYFMQCQIQAAVTGAPEVMLVCWVDGWAEADWPRVRIVSDPAYQAAVIAYLTDWRDRHVIGNEPLGEAPEMPPEMVLPAATSARTVTPDEDALLIEFCSAREDEKDAKARKDSLRQRIRMFADSRHIRFSGGVVTVGEREESPTIDWTRWAAMHPGEHAQRCAEGIIRPGKRSISVTVRER